MKGFIIQGFVGFAMCMLGACTHCMGMCCGGLCYHWLKCRSVRFMVVCCSGGSLIESFWYITLYGIFCTMRVFVGECKGTSTNDWRKWNLIIIRGQQWVNDVVEVGGGSPTAISAIMVANGWSLVLCG